MPLIRSGLAALALLVLANPLAHAADTVRVTPLGGQDGEFCVLDRALVFEDPNGTRILYDAGRTVAGADDPRLGDIDVVLVSHVHGDHLGDRHIPEPNAGSCGSPAASEDDAPLSNSVKIAVAKDARIVTGSEMASFFAGRLQAAGGNPDNSVLVRFGAHVDEGGVGITTVPAVHSNGLSPKFIDGEMGKIYQAAGLTAYVGPPTGYVLTFSNGLVVYLSGDTGITADQEAVVQDYYGAKLAVINIGDTYTTGPTEAAYVVNELVEPASVIPSHANEPATKDGKVQAGTRTAAFIEAVDVPAHVPLSGRTMAFDASGRCAEGC
ncbi:MBL fold metallo-hydrolase [Marinobacter sp. JSM 1782161]|uniref:MBL fold metallo-hydrolase n=1 Tax=Marinobacter sp. JSM 1782161 TaxID=2685906 RepID=UPI001402DC25|nr:MBL fold metallo-hydrolase [Marinobacter sp. JSM 1782161]